MKKPEIGLVKKKFFDCFKYPEAKKVIIPTRCPKCQSKNIIGRGLVIGMAYINLKTMNVDELGDDFEILDKDNLKFRCFDCEWDWEQN